MGEKTCTRKREIAEGKQKQLWVAEEEKRIRGILDQHRIQEKETAKGFKKWRKSPKMQEKNAISDEAKRETMRNEAEALREAKTASDAKLEAQARSNTRQKLFV